MFSFLYKRKNTYIVLGYIILFGIIILIPRFLKFLLEVLNYYDLKKYLISQSIFEIFLVLICLLLYNVSSNKIKLILYVILHFSIYYLFYILYFYVLDENLCFKIVYETYNSLFLIFLRILITLISIISIIKFSKQLYLDTILFNYVIFVLIFIIGVI